MAEVLTTDVTDEIELRRSENEDFGKCLSARVSVARASASTCELSECNPHPTS